MEGKLYMICHFETAVWKAHIEFMPESNMSLTRENCRRFSCWYAKKDTINGWNYII